MKKQIKVLLVALVLCFSFIPAMKANAAAAKPITPSGLGLYSQSSNKFGLQWTFDANLENYSLDYPGYYGYEVVVTTLKNTVIGTYDTENNSYDFGFLKSGKVAAIITNNKMKSAGFKFKVRSFVYDGNQQKVYSDFSKEKVIIPRATVKKGKNVKGNVKITWGKISGAKSYTIYLSSKKNKSYKKVTTTKKTSYTMKKKFKHYKNYYVYVSANSVKYKGKKNSSTKPSDKGSNYYSFYIYTSYK